MLRSKLIKKILLTTVNAFLLIGSVHANPIGGIVESKGTGSLERENKEVVVGTVGTEIQLNDTAQGHALQSDGTYRLTSELIEDGEMPFNSQMWFLESREM